MDEDWRNGFGILIGTAMVRGYAMAHHRLALVTVTFKCFINLTLTLII